MKRMVLLIGVGIASFAAGLVGLYLAMPMLDPDGVQATRSQIDSLLGLNQTAARRIPPQDSIAIPLEPLAMLDALDTLTSQRDSVPAVPFDAHPRFLVMADSIAFFESQVAQLDRDRQAMVERVRELEAELANAGRRGEEAADLSATLTRLEEGELRGILDRIDEGTLARLYHEATGRNKTRILGSLPSDRAARLVQRVMAGHPQPSEPPRFSSEVEVR